MPAKNDNLKDMKSSELIVYQIGEVKNLLENWIIKWENYQKETDKRITALEIIEAKRGESPKVDIQKIILAAFALISTIVATAFGINQTKIGQ